MITWTNDDKRVLAALRIEGDDVETWPNPMRHGPTAWAETPAEPKGERVIVFTEAAFSEYHKTVVDTAAQVSARLAKAEIDHLKARVAELESELKGRQ